ncbi:dihydroorotate dehydrogenase [Brevibacillus sp. H7]|uniref:dihydroorotate dehydrogenase n=1 Tax=Brevibacillus sp. H7 TaxID=3349138 RepID=UPI00380511D7
MPDWSYLPLFRPLLFRLPAEFSRELTLRAMGTLARMPGGTFVIETMGHMNPPASLKRTHWGLSFPSPVGLGAGLDTEARALPALAKFGFGYLELGPVTLEPISPAEKVERRTAEGAIVYPEPQASVGVNPLVNRLEASKPKNLPLAARLGFQPGCGPAEAAAEQISLAEKLAPFCSFFTVETGWKCWEAAEWREHLQRLSQAIRYPMLAVIPPDMSPQELEKMLHPAAELGIQGVVVAGGASVCDETPGFLTGRPTRTCSLETVRYIRERWGERFVVIGSGGIHEPSDALEMLAAGASFVQLHSGLVYSGPGLPKRINEAIVLTQAAKADSAAVPLQKNKIPLLSAWMCAVLLAIGMIVGGSLAWLVAVTTVVLPYDEAFLGITRAQLQQINERLLLFMSHDRISLAGTMISIGIIYLELALFGLRDRLHWARQVLLISGSAGFASFFLFIGYGYFDILHAVLSLSLFPLFVLGVRAPADQTLPALPPQLRNNRTWVCSLWGQLCFVIIGFGLTAAGLVISIIGMTHVFVPEDLAYLCATPEMLSAINERLIPLIAHDRAGFGGALVSDGLAVLLISLWGFRQGSRWIWWTLLLAGVPGFASGIGIHYAVGYTDFWHLFPAFVAALLFAVGLVLTYPYLCHIRKPTRLKTTPKSEE